MNSLQATGLIEEIRLITTDATLESLPDCEILFVDMPYSSATLKAIANAAKGEYTLLYTKETTLEMGMFALERMIHILEDSSAGMVYACLLYTSNTVGGINLCYGTQQVLSGIRIVRGQMNVCQLGKTECPLLCLHPQGEQASHQDNY